MTESPEEMTNPPVMHPRHGQVWMPIVGKMIRSTNSLALCDCQVAWCQSNENERKTGATLAPPFCFQPSHDFLDVAPPNQHDMVVAERIPELDARDRVEIPLSPCRAPLGMIDRDRL